MKLLKYFYKRSFINLVTILYLSVASILAILWINNAGFTVGHNDGYIDRFNDFLNNGWYFENVKGTTTIYYLFLSGIYFLSGDIENSFFILNLFSQLFLLFFGIYMLLKVGKSIKNKYMVQIISALYFFKVLNMAAYVKSSNDFFLGVFVLLVLYVLITKIYLVKVSQKRNFIYIGLLLAISLGVRPTAIFLFPLVLVVIFIKYFQHKNFNKLGVQIVLIFTSFSILSILIHFPSIKENYTFSIYSKNHTDYNWTQRNYLAFKVMDQKGIKYSHDNIWSTSFEDVNKYIELHGDNSLPKNLIEVIQKDIFYYLKIVFYNLKNIILWTIRFFGVFLFIPLYFLFKSKFTIKINLPLVLYSFFILGLSLVVIGLIEFRWFTGFEILIPLSILWFIKNIKSELYGDRGFQIITTTSLLIVTIFNIRTILLI